MTRRGGPLRALWWAIAPCVALGIGACGSGGRERDTGIDADGDGVTANLDCNDADPAAYTWVVAFWDEDGDGYGEEGKASRFCGSGVARAHESLEAGDCAPLDPLRWRLADLVDRDGDGFTVKDATATCAGAVLPEPYRDVAAGDDCDDADPATFVWTVLYPDRDGDAVGARPRSILCIGAALPSGWSRRGDDVDDLDPTAASGPAEAADDLARLLD